MNDIEIKIISVCELLENQEEFKNRIRTVSKEIGSERINQLINLCQKKIEKPQKVNFSKELYKIHKVSNWDVLCRRVIFNIIYEHKAEAVPYLIKNLTNNENLISANCIAQLCKIASEGIGRDYILNQIYNRRKVLSEISKRMLVQGLIIIKDNENVDKIYEDIIEGSIENESSTEDIVQIYRNINFWSKSNQQKTRKYLAYLRKIVNGMAEKYFDKDLELFSPEFTKQRHESVKINSAIFYYQIEPTEEIMDKLIYWKDNAKFETNKKRIKDWLQ